MLNKCIKESRKEGTYNLPQNAGEIILEKEKTDEKTQESFKKKRSESVKDEDIRWWWNLNDIERRMMLKIDEMNRVALFMDRLEKGSTFEEAAKECRKVHPYYGKPEDTTHARRDDAPLPIELKDRINIYIESMISKSEEMKQKIEPHSSFNAFIREEIKNGNV